MVDAGYSSSMSCGVFVCSIYTDGRRALVRDEPHPQAIHGVESSHLQCCFSGLPTTFALQSLGFI